MMLHDHRTNPPFFRLVDSQAQHMRIAAGELHVWSVALNLPETLAISCLSESERERAANLPLSAPRRQYVVARAVLRTLLSRYAGIPVRDIIFGYESHGKPVLKNTDIAEFRFNLSHSGDLALFAMTLAQSVGADVERLRPVAEAELIASRTFSRAEFEQLMMIQEGPARLHAFYCCWTRKEAFIKALGAGLSFPLDKFSVSIEIDQPPRVISISEDLGIAEHWTLYHFEPTPNYIGAVAVEGIPVNILGFALNHPSLFLTENENVHV
jgi:4'-phosphopantetheinyl transferase